MISKMTPYFIIIALFIRAPAFADQPWQQVGKTADQKPAEIEGVGITENLGGQVDLSTEFTDETGQKVPLQKFFDGKRPVVMSLVYYECPMLCNLHLNGVTEVFKKADWKLGQEFDMVVISIDPKETPELAAQKKSAYIKSLGQPEAAKGWHFLTGTQDSINAISGAVGFKYKWDVPTKQWSHTSAMYVLTPTGVISRYLFGIQFPEKDLKLALLESAKGKIGNIIDHLMLYCFQYDPDRQTYAFYAFNIMKFGGGLCALVLGLFLTPYWLRMRRETKLAKGEAT